MERSALRHASARGGKIQEEKKGRESNPAGGRPKRAYENIGGDRRIEDLVVQWVMIEVVGISPQMTLLGKH